ncbi:MAG: hypothetical protein KAR38_02975 [Calditrichia bacterium]|nr:hypothetical protein [Calditrichia bacterium]
MEDNKVSYENYNHPFSDDWMQVLRNQLNIISTSVFLMENDNTEASKMDQLRYLQKIKEAMERINIIVK